MPSTQIDVDEYSYFAGSQGRQMADPGLVCGADQFNEDLQANMEGDFTCQHSSEIAEVDRRKIAFDNTAKLFKL